MLHFKHEMPSQAHGLNGWLPADGAVFWEGLEIVGGRVWLEEVDHWDVPLKVAPCLNSLFW